MPFVTGSVNSLAALQTTIISTCQANGWTLLGTDILNRNSVYVQITNAVSTELDIQGGVSELAGNLVTPGGRFARIRSTEHTALTFPATYRIFLHSNPDFVFVSLNVNVDFYLWMAFGDIRKAGNFVGGPWYAATSHDGIRDFEIRPRALDVVNSSQFTASSGCLFWQTRNEHNSVIQTDMNGQTWGVSSSFYFPGHMSSLMTKEPSAQTQEAILHPYLIHWTDSGTTHQLGDLVHVKYLRMDNLNPLDIVPFGPDRWMVLPQYRKQPTYSSSAIMQSGPLAMAIRYDGP